MMFAFLMIVGLSTTQTFYSALFCYKIHVGYLASECYIVNKAEKKTDI